MQEAQASPALTSASGSHPPLVIAVILVNWESFSRFFSLQELNMFALMLINARQLDVHGLVFSAFFQVLHGHITKPVDIP